MSRFLWLVLYSMLAAASGNDQTVKFSMRNLCGEDIRVFWIGFDGKLVEQSALPTKNSSSVGINSYRSHRFVVTYNRGSDAEVKAHALQEGTQYQVGATNDIVTVEPGLILVRHDAAHRGLEACRLAVQKCDPRAGLPPPSPPPPTQAERSAVAGSSQMSAQCVQGHVADWIADRRGELDFEWTVYRNIK
eukprot:CAMPEP_0172589156 /NCGR_PEP_ID=MMETSP1068-20121228/7954_1 /TAXON_ID=35684 /ORGANISM="Pseudopedinella elastica, Strain CCMP716" /LENGTH=189 /DNA_ID=CAMNT_0013384689 /DNA_START=124 /DNA_END=690 /DNA_ORIENTATION=+